MNNTELVKANVLTYLRTAQEHLDAAMRILSGSCELRNQIHGEVDGPLDGIIYSLENNEYDESEIVGERCRYRPTDCATRPAAPRFH